MAKYHREHPHRGSVGGGAGKTRWPKPCCGKPSDRHSRQHERDRPSPTILEKTYGHSLSSSVVNFPYKGIHVHLVDTPGMPDFAGQSIAALAGVDLAVIVINAQNGIELNTTRMMRAAQKRGLDRMILINKIDADNVDLPGLLERVGGVRQGMPINLPAHGLKDVVDCFFTPDSDAVSPRCRPRLGAHRPGGGS